MFTHCKVLSFLFLPGFLIVVVNRHWCSGFFPDGILCFLRKDWDSVLERAARHARTALCRCALICDKYGPMSEAFSRTCLSSSNRNAWVVRIWIPWFAEEKIHGILREVHITEWCWYCTYMYVYMVSISSKMKWLFDEPRLVLFFISSEMLSYTNANVKWLNAIKPVVWIECSPFAVIVTPGTSPSFVSPFLSSVSGWWVLFVRLSSSSGGKPWLMKYREWMRCTCLHRCPLL